MLHAFTFWTCNCYKINEKMNSLLRKRKSRNILQYTFRIAIWYKFFLYCDIPIYWYIVTPLLNTQGFSGCLAFRLSSSYVLWKLQHKILPKLNINITHSCKKTTLLRLDTSRFTNIKWKWVIPHNLNLVSVPDFCVILKVIIYRIGAI